MGKAHGDENVAQGQLLYDLGHTPRMNAMRFLDFNRSAASVRILVEFGKERGLKPVQLLAGSGLKERDLINPNVELNASQELRAVENLIRACPGPGLGLEVGMRYNFASYGFWGLGLLSSATAADALALALRFVPLTFAYCHISSSLDDEWCTVSFDEPELDLTVQRFLVERDVAAAARLIKETFGSRFALSKFLLKSTSCVDETLCMAIEKEVGVWPQLGAKTNSLSFDRRLLSLALPQANPITVAMCEKACEELIERRRVRSDAAERIRQYLAMTPLHAAPDLAQVAEWIGISDRTLKRRLQDEGTTFRALTAEVRGGQAKELLADGRLSLTDIAERMGFSDLSSFSQAFKRWFGVAPSALRSEGRAGRGR